MNLTLSTTVRKKNPVSSSAGISYVGGKVVTFLASATSTVISLSDLTGGTDSSPQIGDFVLVFYSVSSNSSSRAILIESDYNNFTRIGKNDGYDSNLAGGWKFMGTVVDTEVSISQSFSTSTSSCIVIIHVLRGVHLTSPIESSQTNFYGYNSLLVDPTTIAPIYTKSWVVFAITGAHNQGVQLYSQSGLTEYLTGGINATYDTSMGVGFYHNWEGTSFDPIALGWSGVDGLAFSAAAMAIAIRSAAR